MRGVWRVFRRLGGRKRLSLAGPIALIAVVVSWAAMLVIGWALLLMPHMPDSFTFRGLKTAVARWVESRERAGEPIPVADVAASFQEAVADVLTQRAVLACRDQGVDHLVIGGGVAANSRLRALAEQRCDACSGRRLRAESLAVLVARTSLASISAMTVRDAAQARLWWVSRISRWRSSSVGTSSARLGPSRILCRFPSHGCQTATSPSTCRSA